MIVSFRDEWLRAFFVEDTRSRHIPSGLASRLFRKLRMSDDATTGSATGSRSYAALLPVSAERRTRTIRSAERPKKW